jgi:hypothetical protein
MGNSSGVKKLVEATIFPSPIRLDTLDFSVKQQLNVFLKLKENILNFRFGMKEKNPGEFAEIVNKTHIILKTTNRGYSRAPNICINELKRSSRSMNRN